MSLELQDMLENAVCEKDRVEIFRLVSLGASPDQFNEWGLSPLLFAIEHQLFESVKALVDAGANVNAQNSSGISPLFLAVDISIDSTQQQRKNLRYAPTEIIEFLLDHGADVSLVNQNGRTALDRASCAPAIYDILKKSDERKSK